MSSATSSASSSGTTSCSRACRTRRTRNSSTTSGWRSPSRSAACSITPRSASGAATTKSSARSPGIPRPAPIATVSSPITTGSIPCWAASSPKRTSRAASGRPPPRSATWTFPTAGIPTAAVTRISGRSGTKRRRSNGRATSTRASHPSLASRASPRPTSSKASPSRRTATRPRR
jgi:hypothetical protein